MVFLYTYSSTIILLFYDYWNNEKRRTVDVEISNKKSKKMHMLLFFTLVAGVPPVFVFIVKWGLILKLFLSANRPIALIFIFLLSSVFLLITIFKLFSISSINFRKSRLFSKKNTNFFKKKRLFRVTNMYVLFFTLPVVLVLIWPVFYNW